MSKEISLPYLAGLFDGEGSLGLYEGKTNNFSFRVQMVQNVTPESTVIWNYLLTEWGESLHNSLSPNGNLKMNWQLGQDRAADFLRAIRPWCIMKSSQIDVALDWLDSRPKITRDNKGRIVARSQEDLDHSREVVVLLKSLKRWKGN